MYKEALFWRLTQLRIAIEEEKLHLRDPPKDKTEWWRTQPSYFQAIVPAPPPPPPPPPEDWWKDGTYRGKLFGPLSSDPEKATTKPGESDEMKVTATTWEVPLPVKKEEREREREREKEGNASLFFVKRGRGRESGDV
eukprot:CAMPEP_0182437102 /NCGR_PEP_ID=MMETSP1167-20130531/84806_1 /TAXON_ID=2988 /ORGANISM="Mallomonas Sp, Strain CCMP3275" /LENGTH=137 /DNA_ID=CAMNT_0024629897 /DNA_START=788 /DNA_END=1201 /DNA_ORIENTATION=+